MIVIVALVVDKQASMYDMYLPMVGKVPRFPRKKGAHALKAYIPR